jgi:hypothetical protein
MSCHMFRAQTDLPNKQNTTKGENHWLHYFNTKCLLMECKLKNRLDIVKENPAVKFITF